MKDEPKDELLRRLHPSSLIPHPSSTSARAFSLLAPLYDADQARNRVARWSRRQSLRALDSLFAKGDSVLELGCGTGDEALHLARRGVRVMATDAAPAMIDVLRGKLGREDAATRQLVTTAVMPAASAGDLIRQFGRSSFDGAYSSFGPLNCEPDLRPVVEALSVLVRPGGRVALSLINRFCIGEIAWHLAARQPDKAFRRLRGRAQATVRADWQETRIPVYYWSQRQLERLFSLHFRVVRRKALPWLLPPQYLGGILSGRARLFRLLASVDRRLAGAWPFYTLGDHILFELTRITKDEG